MARVGAAIIFLFLSLMLVLQIPAVQTALARKALNFLPEKIDADISVEGLGYIPGLGLQIKNITVIDRHPYQDGMFHRGWTPVDTLFHAGRISVSFSLKGILSKSPKFRKVRITGGMLHLCTEPVPFPKPPYMNNIRRVFGLEKKNKKPGPDEIFRIKNVELKDFRFRLSNFTREKKKYSGYGFNWDNFGVRADIEACDVRFVDGRMHGKVEKLRAEASCGYRIENLTGSAKVGRGCAFIENMDLTDPWSHIRFKQFSMTYENGLSFIDFVHNVTLEALFCDSRVSFSSIRYFGGIQSEMTALLDVSDSCHVKGPVSDLDVHGMTFKEINSGVEGYIDRCRITGLPDINKTVFDFEIGRLDFKSSDVGPFVRGYAPGAKLDLGKLASGMPLTLKGIGKGSLNDLSLQCELGSPELGKLDADILLSDVLRARTTPLRIDGDISTTALKAGRVINVGLLGETDLSAKVRASLSPGQTVIDIDSLQASRIVLLGHEYSGIRAGGRYTPDKTSIALNGKSSDFDADLEGEMSGGKYKLTGTIRHADIGRMGLSEKLAGLTFLSGGIDADIRSADLKNPEGQIYLDNFKIARGGEKTRLGDLVIIARDKGGSNEVSLESEFADGKYLFKDENRRLELSLHDRKEVIGKLIPGVYIADKTKVSLESSGLEDIKGRISSPRVALKKDNFKNAEISFFKSGEDARLSLRSETGAISGLSLKSPNIELKGRYAKTADGEHLVRMSSDSSFVKFNGHEWKFSDAEVRKAGGDLSVSNFSLANGNQKITVSGGMKKNSRDAMLVNLENLDLAVLNGMTKDSLNLHGTLNGQGRIESPTAGGATISATINGKALSLYGKSIGELAANAGIAGGKVGFNVSNTLDGRKPLFAKGMLDTKGKNIDLSASFDDFDLTPLQPFFGDTFSEMGGNIDGGIKVKGKLDNPQTVSDSLHFDSAYLRIAFTNVKYLFNGPIEIKGKKIILDSVTVDDGENGSGVLNGGLELGKDNRMVLNASLRMKELKLLGTDYTRNADGFYGSAYASGLVKIGGPLGNLAVSADAATAKKGRIHVPLSSASATSGKLLSFAEPEYIADYYESNYLKIREKAKKQGLEAKINLRILPNLEAVVEIDKSRGHAITVEGDGNVTADINTASGKIDLGGDYNISRGKYHLSALEGVLLKDFTIQPGSMIRLNGAPRNSTFDINATYTTKASLAPLMSDTKSVTNRRNVDCKIGISEKLANPKLDFSIEIPDLDPATQSQIQNAFETEDKVQKQFLALLLTGSFIPTEQSGVEFNGGNAVFSNLSSMMSGQLNNILQQLGIPVDMGLNYQMSEAGKNIFDVAISTQLFNNRVIVNGSVGNRQYSNKSGADVVGDVDVEVKLDKAGKYRLKLFSHSADDYTNFLDNTQRNGLGFNFRTEFNTFSQLWQRTVADKDKKRRLELEQLKANRDYKTVKINE